MPRTSVFSSVLVSSKNQSTENVIKQCLLSIWKYELSNLIIVDKKKYAFFIHNRPSASDKKIVKKNFVFEPQRSKGGGGDYPELSDSTNKKNCFMFDFPKST